MLDDRQAQPGAPQLTAPRLVHAVEPLEDPRQLVARDADARVGHVHAHHVGRQRAGHADLSSQRRVLDRVVDQVVEDLPDRLLVGQDQSLSIQAAGIKGERQVLGFRPTPMPLKARLERGNQTQRSVLEELLARIESSQAEHVQDQLVQPVHLLVDPFQEAEVHRLVVEGPVDQCLRVRLDRGERGLELVGGVGDEILPHPLEPAKVSHVVEDQHGPRRGIPRQGKGVPRTERIRDGPRSAASRRGNATSPW